MSPVPLHFDLGDPTAIGSHAHREAVRRRFRAQGRPDDAPPEQVIDDYLKGLHKRGRPERLTVGRSDGQGQPLGLNGAMAGLWDIDRQRAALPPDLERAYDIRYEQLLPDDKAARTLGLTTKAYQRIVWDRLLPLLVASGCFDYTASGNYAPQNAE